MALREALARAVEEVGRLRAHRELCSTNLLKGYETGKEEARDAIGRLQERVAELEATLANERGEGEPPVAGWVWTDCAGWGWAWVFGGASADAWIAVGRKPGAGWYIRLGSAFIGLNKQLATGRAPTARAAMSAASEALAARGAS